MKEGESKKAALILMKNSHFDRTLRYALDLSEFNVNVMTGNNKTYQRSPYDPVIQK